MTYTRLTDVLADCWDRPWGALTGDQRIAWCTSLSIASGGVIKDGERWDNFDSKTRHRVVMGHDGKNDPALEGQRHVGWYNYQLDAETWWGLSSVTPAEAAMLLHEFNPSDDSYDLLTTTNSETAPDDYKRTLRVCEDVAQAEPKARTLLDWLCVAVRKGLKYHSWIEEYALEMTSQRSAPPTATALPNKVANSAESGEYSWIREARTLADSIATNRWESGEREITARNISEIVATELGKDPRSKGQRGPRTAAGIRKEALKGWNFLPPDGGASGASGAS